MIGIDIILVAGEHADSSEAGVLEGNEQRVDWNSPTNAADATSTHGHQSARKSSDGRVGSPDLPQFHSAHINRHQLQ